MRVRVLIITKHAVIASDLRSEIGKYFIHTYKRQSLLTNDFFVAVNFVCGIFQPFDLIVKYSKFDECRAAAGAAGNSCRH